MKDVILLTRYPYTAVIIAVMWIGVALIGAIRGDVALEIILVLLAVATLVIAKIGFSTTKRY